MGSNLINKSIYATAWTASGKKLWKHRDTGPFPQLLGQEAMLAAIPAPQSHILKLAFLSICHRKGSLQWKALMPYLHPHPIQSQTVTKGRVGLFCNQAFGMGHTTLYP